MYSSIIFFVCGIILFLFGVSLLSEKLKNYVKERITFHLRKITKRPLYGVLFGTFFTAIGQSSSAITALSIALVSSGILSFYNSLPILFGANIGTTITVNLVALGITKISFIFVLLGFVLLFIKRTKKIGEIIFCIGLVFFGLFLVSYSLEPLKPAFGKFSSIKNPYLAFFYSILFTGIIQSSAITISSAIIFAEHNLINSPSLIGIVLGANIGTTVTALIASVGTSINGKRTALAHFFFNLFGALLFLPFLWPINSLLHKIEIPLAFKISFFHFFFNLIMAVIFLLMLRPYASLIKKILPGKDHSTSFLPFYLNKNFLKKPEKALLLIKKELKREAQLAKKIVEKSFSLLKKFDEKKAEEVMIMEEAVDNLQGEIASFIEETLKKNPKMSKELLKKFITFSLVVDEIERIADRADNIAQIARYKEKNKEEFSKQTQFFMEELEKKILQLISEYFEVFDKKSYNKKLKDEIKDYIKKFKEVYKLKLIVKEESPATAMLFSEIMVNIERIVANCENVAEQLSKI